MIIRKFTHVNKNNSNYVKIMKFNKIMVVILWIINSLLAELSIYAKYSQLPFLIC